MNKLTICIPVYERIDYFESAIESALNQTVKCDILVSDNASSHTKFRDFCELNNIPYFRNENNLGVFGNWNKCIELAKTPFALILSDDDVLKQTYVEDFLNTLREHPQLDMYYTNFDIYDFGSKEFLSHHHCIPFGYFENNLEVLKYGVEHGLSFPIFTTAIKKSKFDGFQEKFHSCSDWIWMYSEIRKLNLFGNENLLVTRGNHDNNDSKNSDTSVRALVGMSYIYGIRLNEIFNKNYRLKLKSIVKANSVIINLFAYNENDKIQRILDNRFNIYGAMIQKKYFLKFVPKAILKLIYQLFFRRYFG